MEKKKIRTKGKLQLSRYFQKFEKGNVVAVIREIAMIPRFPKRIQGKTGIIEEKKGKHYVVKIKDISKEKKFSIHPIHLKKIEQIQKNDK